MNGPCLEKLGDLHTFKTIYINHYFLPFLVFILVSFGYSLGGERKKTFLHLLVFCILLSNHPVRSIGFHKTIIFTDYFSDSSASKAAFASLAAFHVLFQGHPHESHHRLPLHRGHEVPLLDHLRPRHVCQDHKRLQFFDKNAEGFWYTWFWNWFTFW